MTCLEKFLLEHPDHKGHELLVIEELCPNGSTAQINIEDHPKCDPHTGKYCCACWNRQAPGTETASPTIQDSGTRQEFPTGAVRDIQKGKGRCDLLPLDVVAEFLGAVGEPDCVLMRIATFMGTGQINHLHYALEMFRNMMGIPTETMLLEVSKHFEEGAEKYGEGNWQKGLPVKCYINSGVRHYLKYLRGDKDERHDRAFCWNILCAIWTCIHMPELNSYALTKKECEVKEYEEQTAAQS